MSKQLVVFLQPKTRNGHEFDAIDHFTGDVSPYAHMCRRIQLQLAHENSQLLQLNTVTGKQRRVDPSKAVANMYVDGDGNATTSKSSPSKSPKKKQKNNKDVPVDVNFIVPEEILNEDARKYIDNAAAFKPAEIIISDIKWKYLVRSILRGKNILITGDSGSGKTSIGRLAAVALKRDLFYFNLGQSQDPRGYLLGNTHYAADTGTLFDPSRFVQAIQVPNSIILLDELSRAHPDAWNILMSVLDPGLRCLSLDEAIGSPTIKVADGVCFIATANIGIKYTATKVLDRALSDRFIIMEMDMLSGAQETELLSAKYNIPHNMAVAIGDIAEVTRQEIISDAPKISSVISTRITKEMAELIQDGLTLDEAATVCIYPFYDSEGGVNSERTFMKQLVQKHIVE